MTVIATALKHLMAAGVTGDALIAAIAEIEAALPGAQPIEPQRSKAAIRQERYRRNKASQNVTNCVTGVTNHNENVTSDDEHNAAPLPLPPNDINSNPPTPTPGDNTPREREAADAHVADWTAWRAKHPYPRPHWAPVDLWADFMAVRKRKSATNSKTAHDRLLRDVDAMSARTGWPPGKILRACVERDWKGIYETDEMKAAINGNGSGNRNGAPRNRGERDNRDGFERAIDRNREQRLAAERPATGGDGGGRELARSQHSFL